jgi:hypothetical protein
MLLAVIRRRYAKPPYYTAKCMSELPDQAKFCALTDAGRMGSAQCSVHPVSLSAVTQELPVKIRLADDKLPRIPESGVGGNSETIEGTVRIFLFYSRLMFPVIPENDVHYADIIALRCPRQTHTCFLITAQPFSQNAMLWDSSGNSDFHRCRISPSESRFESSRNTTALCASFGNNPGPAG